MSRTQQRRPGRGGAENQAPASDSSAASITCPTDHHPRHGHCARALQLRAEAEADAVQRLQLHDNAYEADAASRLRDPVVRRYRRLVRKAA